MIRYTLTRIVVPYNGDLRKFFFPKYHLIECKLNSSHISVHSQNIFHKFQTIDDNPVHVYQLWSKCKNDALYPKWLSMWRAHKFNSFTAQEIHLMAYIYRDWFIVKNGNGSGDIFLKYYIRKQKALILDGEWH